ncbi:arginase family protein [Arthrobacter sp. H35-D1]|uniref:arginase family protein n=1 Tax=Arthrobacter sp. H35-D1 TaxID=3046202 RepID=UPI0024B97F9E|nr:arginase family protein [Arthrobacter sp. H35-D1]MDJ0315010.1 arginase family protein [Arthrobacter sp. H35-D1]
MAPNQAVAPLAATDITHLDAAIAIRKRKDTPDGKGPSGPDCGYNDVANTHGLVPRNRAYPINQSGRPTTVPQAVPRADGESMPKGFGSFRATGPSLAYSGIQSASDIALAWEQPKPVAADEAGIWVTDGDLQLVVPLWQGSGEPRISEGSTRLAAMLASSVVRHVVNPDLGTLDAPPDSGAASLVESHDAVEAHLVAASEILQDLGPRSLLTLGGDCTVEVASVSHMASIHPDLRLVWIDAHGDLNTPESSPSGHAHGMALRILFGEGHPAWYRPLPCHRRDAP